MLGVISMIEKLKEKYVFFDVLRKAETLGIESYHPSSFTE